MSLTKEQIDALNLIVNGPDEYQEQGLNGLVNQMISGREDLLALLRIHEDFNADVAPGEGSELRASIARAKLKIQVAAQALVALMRS